MENKNIIIILIIVIVVLAAAIGVMFLQQSNDKEQTKIKITSDKTQYEDDGELSIKLTDLNNTPISKELVNVTITNKKGKVVVDDVVKTNSKGKAKLNLDLKKGKYTVNVTFGGNENYSECNETQKLTIKEQVAEVVSSQSSSSYSSSQDSIREEYKVTSDGWNPREHEVSRESIGDGYEKVMYDDNYMRVVDSQGNIVTYGYAG